MTALMHKVFKNHYVYAVDDFVRRAIGYGLPMAVKTAAAKESPQGKNAAAINRSGLLKRLLAQGKVIIEPEEVLFTSAEYGDTSYKTPVYRKDMLALCRELEGGGVKLYIKAKDEEIKKIVAECGCNIANSLDAAPVMSNAAGADIYIPSPKQVFEDSPVYGLFKRYITSNQNMLGLFVSKLYNSPFGFTLDDEEAVGFCVFAPLLYKYISTLAKKSAGYDRLWFLARDGWLLKELFELYTGKVDKCRYFLTSRRAASLAAIRDSSDIAEIASQYYRGSFKNMLYTRFGEQSSSSVNISLPEDLQSVLELIKPYENNILQRAAREREQYLSYIGDTDGKVLLADVGYKGTIQYWLYRLTDKVLDGYYICTRFDNRLALLECKCEGLSNVKNSYAEGKNHIYPHHLYLEAVLKAPFGQLVCFEDGSPIYLGEGEQDKTVLQIQKGIVDFFKAYKNNGDSDSELAEYIFDIGIKKGFISERIRRGLYVEDSYCTDGKQRVGI